tara:strand:- start:4568 stop:5653 length:1086 start_codon:yes stop_codon:yes gene_type:complete
MTMNFSKYFGVSLDDVLQIKQETRELMTDDRHAAARRTLDAVSPSTSLAIRSALLEKTHLMQSEMGHIQRISTIRDGRTWFAQREDVVLNFMAEPLNFRDAAVWTMFMATLEATTEFQIHHCITEAKEDRLTGNLIGLWGSQCRQWGKRMIKVLKGQRSELLLHELDLSIGGGEQADGGDFGVILDFEGMTGASGGAPVRHIVPLVLQAKRYQRPTADISHISAGIIKQRTLLQSNPCASAYIFYENAKEGIAHPLPALVKAAAAVGSANRTDVLTDSLDLASYLLVVLADPSLGIRAQSPKDALNMIYDRASFNKLSALMVVSSDGTAGPRYQNACSEVVVERAQDYEPPEEEYEPPIPT